MRTDVHGKVLDTGGSPRIYVNEETGEIRIEGPDGSGKSLLASIIYLSLKEVGYNNIVYENTDQTMLLSQDNLCNLIEKMNAQTNVVLDRAIRIVEVDTGLMKASSR